MLNLYDSRNSGNGWKIRLLLSHLGLPFTRHILNLAAGEAKTPTFLKLNPLARVPVLVLDDGTPLCESNAILLYLAQGTRYLPTDLKELALVWQWLFFEQYDHLKYFARPRFLISIAKTAASFTDEITALRTAGEKALIALERRLSNSPYLAGANYTIADIALFPYTSMAEMGGYELEGYPSVRAWITRVRSQPGFIPLIAEGG